MSDPQPSILKRLLRVQVTAARRAQRDKDRLSEQIRERLWQLPEFATAAQPLIYVDVRDEVRTRPLLSQLLARNARVVLPYCVGAELKLFRLCDEAELQPGAFGILEPARAWRDDADRSVSPFEVDVILVPGVAFDRNGSRLGHGHGYYDRLLARTNRATPRIALAYDCQLVERIPRDSHDMMVDKVVTPTQIITANPVEEIS